MTTADKTSTGADGPAPHSWRTRLIRVAFGPAAAARAAADEAAGLPHRGGQVAATLALVGATALAGVLGAQLLRVHLTDRDAEAGRQAAVAYATALTSIDSEHVDDDFAVVLNGATGEFKDTYSKASSNLRQLLIDHRATAKGRVVGSGVQSQSRDQVVVLVLVDQTITNTTKPDPRVDRPRMKLTMDHVDGRWLASRVELP